MKELSGHDVLDIVLKDKDSCSIHDINIWKEKYNKQYPNVYVNTSIIEMKYIHSHFYYWNNKEEKFYKQIILKCPICDDEHYKYPINDKYQKLEKFYKIHKLHERSNGKGKIIK